MLTLKKFIHKPRKAIISLMTSCFLFSAINATAQNPGDRAQKFRGTWWGGVHPSLLDDRLLSLKTIDGWGVGFTNGAAFSAQHFAPVPLLSGLDGADAVFPPNGDTTNQGYIDKIRNAGFKVQAYTNCENFLGANASQFEEFVESWKEWCDTDPRAQAFINSQPYHRKAGYPDRPYMFCYAEFILKYYSQQYGKDIAIWVFDDAFSMVEQGDNATSGVVDDQRLYLAFAEAARAGNDSIAVAFNNGRSNLNYASYPFAHATRADDFTFGHAFGGNNNHAEKVNGNQFNLNYQHIQRMTETNGLVHDGGSRTWDDNVVGHYFSKLSTTAWNFGPVQAWEQDDFNQWHEEALSAGGMLTWSGSYGRNRDFVHEWVYELLEATDNYLFERGISVNGAPVDIPALIQAEDFTAQSGIRTEVTQDIGGGENVGFIRTGSYFEYEVNVPRTGQYQVDFRLASRSGGGSFNILQGNSVVGNVTVEATGGWQTWETVSTTVNLNAGTQTIRLFATSPGWNINWLEFTQSTNLVHITKRNSRGFAIDSGGTPINGTAVYLWRANANNQNQQWEEIDRGGGYYSYQKANTTFSLDGGRGGANRQDIYLWSTADNNYNQQWQKVAVGGGAYKLIKRNASYAINGGNGGVNGQNVNLYESSETSQNLNWFLTPINN